LTIFKLAAITAAVARLFHPSLLAQGMAGLLDHIRSPASNRLKFASSIV
jgi:hypothetical protein